MRYLIDNMRHIVCVPYSVDNLHKMAEDLGIKRCWFHKNHYDAPKKRHAQLMADPRCEVVDPRTILKVIRGEIT